MVCSLTSEHFACHEGREMTNRRVSSPSARQSRSEAPPIAVCRGAGGPRRWPLSTASRPATGRALGRGRRRRAYTRAHRRLALTRIAPAVPPTRHRGPWRCDCVGHHRRDPAANPLEPVGDDIGPSVLTMLELWPRSTWMRPPPTGNRLAGRGNRVGRCMALKGAGRRTWGRLDGQRASRRLTNPARRRDS
jgi:hypothetical protein